MKKWQERSHGILSFILIQVLLGHGCFERCLCRIRLEPTPECRHCSAVGLSSERRVVVASIWQDLSLLAMVRSQEARSSVAFFLRGRFTRKEVAERERVQLARSLSRRQDKNKLAWRAQFAKGSFAVMEGIPRELEGRPPNHNSLGEGQFVPVCPLLAYLPAAST